MKHEKECDEFVAGLITPPPIPPTPKVKKTKRAKSMKSIQNIKQKSALLMSPEAQKAMKEHLEKLKNAGSVVDKAPPALNFEAAFKPQRFAVYARLLRQLNVANQKLVERIRISQIDRGLVDCWKDMSDRKLMNKLLYMQRKRQWESIDDENLKKYENIRSARSNLLTTKQLDEEWLNTKEILISKSLMPFILFEREQIDRGIIDINITKPLNYKRPKVAMQFMSNGFFKTRKVYAELFSDIAPETVKLFLMLVKGDSTGHAYSGTNFFRVVPKLYARGGDVTKNNGLGKYVPHGINNAPENYKIKHTVPGMLSMSLNEDKRITGQFNIIFKPLPQLDNKNVVFGRIVSGPIETMDIISSHGLPRGTVSGQISIAECGRVTKDGYEKGKPNAIKFARKKFETEEALEA